MNSFLIAAPASGSGKTLVTLGLLRAFRNNGTKITAAKAGPDYIDPAFHMAAMGVESVNLDPWAMRHSTLLGLASDTSKSSEIMIVEGMMGLFDGAADGTGNAADLAETLGLPVVLVIDVSSMSFSVAALAKGFRDHRDTLSFAGVILNKVGSPRHETMLRSALETVDIAVLGAVPRIKSLELPSRHLGLVQAGEHENLERFISQATDHVAAHCDLEALAALDGKTIDEKKVSGFQPLGQRIAIAKDQAFAFSYPHMLSAWRKAGAELSFFSPLGDEKPTEDADAIFLPGGYPELHAEKLANAAAFRKGMRDAEKAGKLIYGECGGYMVLGEGIVDADGTRHSMLGLLNLETSFEQRKLHLGYRQIEAEGFALGDRLKGHEFHYTTALREDGVPLFKAHDALGACLGNTGLRNGTVMGSYLHVIDRAA